MAQGILIPPFSYGCRLVGSLHFFFFKIERKIIKLINYFYVILNLFYLFILCTNNLILFI